MPTIPEALSLAVQHHQAGRLPQAAQIYEQILRVDPQQAHAWYLFGALAQQLGRHEEAIDRLTRALEIRPAVAEYHNMLAVSYRATGKLAEAVETYRHALMINPEYSEAHNNLANALKDLGRLDEAAAHCRRALEIEPDFPEAHNNLANARAAEGKLDEAVEGYRRALQCRPDYAEAHYNLGVALKDQQKLDDAVDSYRRALAIRPDYPEAYLNLGNVLAEQEKMDEAADSYRRLRQLQPGQPLWELRIATLCPSVFGSNEQIDRYRDTLLDDLKHLSGTDWQIDLARLSLLGSEPPFGLQYQGRDDRPIKEAYAELFGGCFPQDAPAPANALPRIGLVVTKGHESVFLKCMRGVLGRLDPGAFETVVVCWPAGAATIRAAVRSESVRLLAVPERFDRAVEAIRAARFDLLYFWEVGTDPTNYFLPFFRLAPVQCTSWGVPVTSGIPQIDYFLSSELVETEDSDGHYTETLLRAETLLTFQERVALPESPKPREDFGFTARQHVYLCAQNLRKLHPDFDPILAAILRRDGDGLVVITEDKHGYAAGRLRERFSRTIPEAADRIVFLPWQAYSDYLSLLAAADVLLDPLHFGGGVTAYDGLSLDRPIVTLPGRFRRGRYTLACYRKMGLTDCVAGDADDYVDKAVRLGTDADYRADVEQRIRQTSPVLFEDEQAVREHERLFRELLAKEKA